MVKKRKSPTTPPKNLSLEGGNKFYFSALTLALLGSLVLRIVLAHQVEYPQVDGVYYLDQARELVARGHLPHRSFPPGFPLLISIVLLGLDLNDPLAPLRAAQAVNVVFGTLFGFLSFIYLRHKLTVPWALAGAVVILFLPHLVFYSKIDMSEMTYACFLLGGWLIWHRGHQFTSGLLFGYAYLIRPEVLIVPTALGLLQVRRERKVPWRLVLGILIPVIPYLVFLKTQTGHWTLSSKGVFLSLALQDNSGMDLAHLVLGNLKDILSGILGLLGLPLMILALVGAWGSQNRWLVALAPLAVLPLFPFPMLPRFWLPYLPFLLMGAWRGIELLGRKIPRSESPPVVVVAILVILVGLGLAIRDDAYLYTKKQEVYPNLKLAGLWLRERIDRNTVVAAYKSQVSFWAWSRFSKISCEKDLIEAIDEVKAAGARFLVVDVYTSMYFCPELLQLLRNPDSPLPPDLDSRVSLVYFGANEKDYRQNLCLYELK